MREGADAVRFEFAAYDRSRAMNIDPGLVFSTYLGGSPGSSPDGNDQGNAIAVDSSGDVFVTGPTASADFPTTNGAFQTTNKGASEDTTTAFVTKLKADGSALIYSTFLGGNGHELPTGIAVDSKSGDAYLSGRTDSLTNADCTGADMAGPGNNLACCTGVGTGTCVPFPTTADAFQTANAGGDDTFVTKLNADGTALVYSTLIGGSGDDKGSGLAIDSSGDAYITGKTSSISNVSCTAAGSPKDCCTGAKTGTCVAFPTTLGAFQTSNNGAPNGKGNAFVAKLNATGSALSYSTYLGGSEGDGANHIAIDSSLNAYVTGSANSADFPITKGAFQTTNKAAANGGDAFVTKLNAGGTGLVYSTYLGGSGDMGQGDGGDGIAVDSFGNAYVTGFADSFDNSSCTANGAPGLCCSGSGTGTCVGFPTTPGAFQTANNSAGSGVGFVTKLTTDGKALVYSTYLGGNSSSGYDQGTGIAVDSSGNAYVTGFASSFNNASCTGNGVPGPCCTGTGTGSCIGFPIAGDAFQSVNNSAPNGGNNAFITILDATGAGLLYSTYLGGSGGTSSPDGPTNGDQGNGIAIDSLGNAYVTGIVVSDDFPVTAGAYQTTNKAASGGSNAFVAELMPFSSTPMPTGTATITPTVTSSPNGTAPPTPSTTATATATATSTSTPTPVAGKLTISPPTLNFGTVTVNSPKVKTLKVTNAGKIGKLGTPPSILVKMESVSGSPAPSPFSVTTPCSNDELQPGGKGVPVNETFCEVGVQFKPTEAVSYTGTLTIFDNLEGSGMQTISLSGKGKAAK